MNSDVQQRNEELKQQEHFIREKTIEIAKDALLVLSADLPLFVEREVKRAFIADPRFADTISMDALKLLKEQLRTKGRARTEEIVSALQNWDLWMAGHQHLEGAKSLEDHKEIWPIVDRISDLVREILAEHNFPEPLRGAEIRYRQPTWFISGRLMTTIAEKYWRKMIEWAEVLRELEELNNQARREELKKRWEEI